MELRLPHHSSFFFFFFFFYCSILPWEFYEWLNAPTCAAPYLSPGLILSFGFPSEEVKEEALPVHEHPTTARTQIRKETMTMTDPS